MNEVLMIDSTVAWLNDSLILNVNSGKWTFKIWGVIWPKDSKVLIQSWHQGVFWPDHTPIVYVPNFIPGV